MEDLIMKIIDIEDRAQEVIRDEKKPTESLMSVSGTIRVSCRMILQERLRQRTSLLSR